MEKATNAKTLTVTFNKPVTAADADFSVNKGTVKANIAAIALSEDKKTATIELTSKMTAGEYTVTVAQKDADALKGSVTVENEKVSAINVLSDKAAFVDAGKTSATVTVQVVNQYGEDITKLNASDVTVTAGGIATDARLATDGTLTIDLPAGGTAKDGDKAVITLVHGKTGVSTQATVTLSAVSAISEISFGELYNKDGKKLSQDTDFSKDKFYLPVMTKDQYGKDIKDLVKINDEVLFTNTNPAIFTLGNSNKVKNVTINGKETQVLEVVDTNLAGAADLIAVSKTSGKSAKTSVTVEQGVTYSSISVGAPTEVLSAGKTAYFPLTVTDSNGNAVSTKKAEAAIKQDTLTASSGYLIKEVEGKEGLFVVVPGGSVVKDQAVTVVVTTKSGKVATQTLVAKEAAKATVITGIDSEKSTALRASGDSVTINNTDLIVEDQYGQVITDEAALDAITFTAEAANDASAAAFTVATASGNKSVTVTPKANTTEVGGKVTFKLTGTGAEASALTQAFTIVKDAQFESYTVADVAPIYVKSGVVATGYDKAIKVKAKTASGEVVNLVQGADFTVRGKQAEGDAVVIPEGETSVTKTATITINATGEELTKEITYSNVAPKVAKVQLVKNNSVVKTSGTVGEAIAITPSTKIEEVDSVTFAGGKVFTITELAKLVDFVVTDSYGKTVAGDEQGETLTITLGDTVEVDTQTLTLSKVSGDVTFNNNGLESAMVSEFTAESEWNSIFKLAGVAGNTVKVKATTAYSTNATAASAVDTLITDANNRTLVEAARAAYVELTPAQKALVTKEAALQTKEQGLVDAEALTASTTPFTATAATGTVTLPSVGAGYSIKVKTTSDAAKYDIDGKVQATGSSNVVFTVTHTASGKTKDTTPVVVNVTAS